MPDKKPSSLDPPSFGLSAPDRQALTLDVSAYENYLENADLSEGQKREFLEALWSIIVGFIDLGFEIHPLQLAAAEGCGQNAEIAELVAKKPEIVVGSKNTFNIKSKHSGGGQSGLSREGSQE